MSLCENDCEYKGYDSNIKKAICDCNIKSTNTVSEENEVNQLLIIFFLNIFNRLSQK